MIRLNAVWAAGAAVFIGVTSSFGGAATAKDTLTLGIALEPPHLDPTAGAAAAIDEVVYGNVFEGLTRIDRNATVQPALAESWHISDDGLTYTFKLKSGVEFHDGTALDAGDVVFTLDRARGEDSVNAQKQLFGAIETVEAVDDLTVKVTLKNQSGRFLYNLGWGDAVIVAPESAETNKATPVGTGPFKFADWAKGSAIKIARNPDYHGTQPQLSEVTFRVITDRQAQIAALKAGDVDAIPNLGASEALPDFKADPNFHVEIGATEGETILAMNNAKPFLDDVRVRRAISHAIDKEAILIAQESQAKIIGSHFSPSHPAYIDLTGTYPYDTDRARTLLAEAGATDLTLTMILPPPSYARVGGEIIAAMLLDVGIKTEIENVEWAQWLDRVFKRTDYDLTIVSHTEPLDIGIYARDNYYFNYQSAPAKKLFESIAVETNPVMQRSFYRDFQKLITTEAVNVYLYMLPKNGVWNAKLRGLWANSPVQANDVTEVYWAN
ncbi:MAG: ABC transporter substrate-binding protein [Alphaproteobacteria bacterium]|nr:ABC transporter substrate-binding protein [Alphaproteobacteria bacterium]